jgi:NYN domain/SAP domain
LTSDALVTASDRPVFHRRLVLLVLCLTLFAQEVDARLHGDYSYSEQRFIQYCSKRLSPGFGLYQPLLRNDHRRNYDRRESLVVSRFVSNPNQSRVCSYYRQQRSSILPLPLRASIDGEHDNGSVGSQSFDPVESTSAVQSLEFMQTIILQQQRQIETLLQLLQQQRSPAMNAEVAVIGDAYGLLPSPLLFQPLPPQLVQNSTNRPTSHIGSVTTSISTGQRPHTSKNVLKAMLFIDGTWLYYSIHERLAKDCSIIQKYGRGWQHRYDIDWAKLPSLLCQTMQREIMEQVRETTGMDSPEEVEIHLVRSSVYTSYKADTPTTSYRYKLFQELQKANYHVHMMETVGKSEKCVDIQLAVEILHYATMENPVNSYDIALLLTGDKDLMPAIIRTRCKGKRVGLVSMRPGCNRALVDTPGLLDFDVIWMEDFLDQLVVPRLFHDGDIVGVSESNAGNESYLPTILNILHKVVCDFIQCSGLSKVSSRDLGRYLKQLSVGGTTLLDTMKRYYGGMYQYLSSMGYYDCELPSFTQNATDHSYWISLTATFVNRDGECFAGVDDFQFNEPIIQASLTEAENQFSSTYSLEPLVSDRNILYMHSLARMFSFDPGEIKPSPDLRSDFLKLSSPQRVPVSEASDIMDGLGESVELRSKSQIPDYSGLTVVELKEVCRERGLAVSGTKAALLGRIQDWMKNDRPSDLPRPDMDNRNKERAMSLPHPHDDPVAVHLKELILEYLHAKGGVANSRMIGRYLSVNKASPQNDGHASNALKEMKSTYGNLNTFVAMFSDTFISFKDNRSNNNSIDGSSSSSSGGNDDFGFSIALVNNKREKDHVRLY